MFNKYILEFTKTVKTNNIGVEKFEYKGLYIINV